MIIPYNKYYLRKKKGKHEAPSKVKIKNKKESFSLKISLSSIMPSNP